MQALFFFLIAMSILICVHELGHYWVARLCHVKVLRFSIGFGKILYRRVNQKTQTEWVISALPFGGYVKMLGERDLQQPISDSDRLFAFNRQVPWKKMAIIAAGPGANFLLAMALLCMVFWQSGVSQINPVLALPAPHSVAALAGLQAGDRILSVQQAGSWLPIHSWAQFRGQLENAIQKKTQLKMHVQQHNQAPRTIVLPSFNVTSFSPQVMAQLGFLPDFHGVKILEVEPGSLAQQAGLRADDVVLKVNAVQLSDVQALQKIFDSRKQSLWMQLQRDGQEKTIVVPRVKAGEQPRLGMVFSPNYAVHHVQLGLWESVVLGVKKTWHLAYFSVASFSKILTGEISLKHLSGPVGIAQYAGKTAEQGLKAYVSFLAVVSIAIGVLNLLPIPVLDGGHLLYYAFEWVTGRSVVESVQVLMQKIGFLLILGLSVFAFYNDLSRSFHF